MKNISIITQIAIINIIVMAIFMTIFISKNYETVSNQFVVLEDEKISSIVQTLKPVVAINLSLGLESNYKESIKNMMQTYQEIEGIELLDENKHLIYQDFKSKSKPKNTKIYTIALEDSLLKTSIGTMSVHYTFAKLYTKILDDFFEFLFWMFLFFVFSLAISTLLIKYNLNPLKALKQKMIAYKLSDKTPFKMINGKNEIAIINNTALEMLQRIEKEVEIRLMYEKEIMQKTRLASMGQMLDNIAHQWRQPLMKINGILLNIDRTIELKKYDENYLAQKINEASNTIYFMSQTIDVFREFVNPNKAKQNFELISAIEKSINFLDSRLKKCGIQSKFDKNFELIGMENEFIQVMISLLTNSIEIFEDKNIEQQRLNIEIFKNQSNINIIIEDNGGGIREEILEQIFDPYFTTKQKVGGSGMGLYICKLIIENSFQGTITATNGEMGAKFIITFKDNQ